MILESIKKLSWTDLKTLTASKQLDLQFVEQPTLYIVMLIDNGLTLYASIEKSTPANSDQLDFENNYKLSANKPLRNFSAFRAYSDVNNIVSNANLPAYLGTPISDIITIGAALPVLPSDTWSASGWTEVKDFSTLGFTARATALGRGYALWSSDGGNTVCRYESTLFGAGAGAFSDPPQGATHLKIAFQNLSATTNTFNLNTILRYQAPGMFMAPVNSPVDPSFPAALTKSILTGQKPDTSFDNQRIQGQEPTNSTTTPLAANATYRGTWFRWRDNYIKLALSVTSDVPGTIWIDLSEVEVPTNGDDSSITSSLTYSYNSSLEPLFKEQIPVQSEWVRVRFGNGSSAQSFFSLDTLMLVSDPGLTMLQLRTLPVKGQLAGVTRAISTIPTADNTGYQDVPVASTGDPKTYVSHIQDDVLIEPLSSGQASQTIVGTTPVQLDSSVLANRRVIGIDNEGPVRIAVGHSSGITFDTGSIRIPVGASKIFGIDSSLPLWAVAEDLGGIQTTLTRSASTATGTASNPSNALTSNNSYAQMTAASQTVDTSGYTAGTTNALVSVKMGIEGNKAAGVTQTVTFQEHQTGSAGNVMSVSTTSSLTGVAGHIYLAAISRRNASATVNSVSGLGLTWGQLTTQANGGAGVVDVWYALGTPTSNTAVTATFNTTATNCHIAVTRYSNVNPVTPIQDFDVGQAGNSSPTTPALTTATNGYTYMAVFGANRTMTAGGTYTLRSSELISAAGSSDSLSVEDKAITSGGTDTSTGTLSGNANWAAISVSLTPADPINPSLTLSYTLSGVPGATSGTIVFSSGTDSTFKVDVTVDRSWTIADIPNVHVIATGLSIGGAPLNIDQIFLELTDTTGNTTRVSVWQGAKAVS